MPDIYITVLITFMCVWGEAYLSVRPKGQNLTVSALKDIAPYHERQLSLTHIGDKCRYSTSSEKTQKEKESDSFHLNSIRA